MALLTWSDKLSVGVPSMDDQHTVLIESLNELHDAMMKGHAKEKTGTLLQTLVSYTRDHFAAEEAMMHASGYPGLAQHRMKHQALTQQVDHFVERYHHGEVALNLYLLHFLRDWLTTHIQVEDKEYGPWIKSHTGSTMHLAAK